MQPASFPSAPKNTRLLMQLTIILLFLFLTVPLSAQTFILKGKVADKTGPVMAATVFLKGTHAGTSTDIKGKFSMRLRSLPATIVFSCVGYEKIEKKLRVKDLKDSVVEINITLVSAKNELTEVVVTSLGSVRSSKVLGYTPASVSSSPATTRAIKSSLRRDAAVDETLLKDRTPLEYDSRDKAMTGKVSGLAVISAGEKMVPAALKKEASEYKALPLTNTRSRLLTAGELNDFKKWKMWEDYNNNEFRTYSEQWELFATERYCVQLLNKDKKAVVGEKIYLLDNTTGDTLWSSVSDNTGKAELWNGFNGKGENQSLVIAVEKHRKYFSAIPFTQGINQIVIDHTCTVSNKVEIAFVVDATGSMEDEINYLKEELEDVLTKITAKDPGIDLYTGAVFYRDKSDEYVTKERELTRGISNTIDFIKQQFAAGGDDYPEAVNEGLKVAIEKLQWSAGARTRIIFLLMDAPPHDEAKMKLQH